MDPLMKASSEAGNIDGLYAAIRENPHILCLIDEIPFAETPLHAAAASGHIQYAMEIMRLKPSFARKPNHYGFTPIHVALQRKNSQMVLWLVDKDSEVIRVKGREGITPLHYVAEKGNLHLLDRFLSVCPRAIEDVTIRNETALHIALKNNKLEIFQVLIDRLFQDNQKKDNHNWQKMVLNCKDVEGNTVLHVATCRNQPQALQILMKYKNENPGMLEAGAVNNNGKTASDMALSSRHMEKLLRQIASDSVVISNPIIPSPQQQITQNQDPTSPAAGESTSPGREGILHWADYFKFEYGKAKPDRTRSDLLVVAVLMATATYQAGLSPPGGLAENKPEALLASSHPWLYIMFITFNSIGFFISLDTIRVLIYKYPLYWETYVAMLAMIATYDCAINAISPPGYMRKLFGVISIVMPFLVSSIPFLMRICCKGLGRRSHA